MRGSPLSSSVTVTKQQDWMSAGVIAWRYLVLSRERSTMPSSISWASVVAAVKPSKRGQPTTVSTFSSSGGVEMPKSFRWFLPS